MNNYSRTNNVDPLNGRTFTHKHMRDKELDQVKKTLTHLIFTSRHDHQLRRPDKRKYDFAAWPFYKRPDDNQHQMELSLILFQMQARKMQDQKLSRKEKYSWNESN